MTGFLLVWLYMEHGTWNVGDGNTWSLYDHRIWTLGALFINTITNTKLGKFGKPRYTRARGQHEGNELYEFGHRNCNLSEQDLLYTPRHTHRYTYAATIMEHFARLPLPPSIYSAKVREVTENMTGDFARYSVVRVANSRSSLPLLPPALYLLTGCAVRSGNVSGPCFCCNTTDKKNGRRLSRCWPRKSGKESSPSKFDSFLQGWTIENRLNGGPCWDSLVDWAGEEGAHGPGPVIFCPQVKEEAISLKLLAY